MDDRQGPRAELGAFLRSRRASASRAAHGLPPSGRSRAGGLRREEVAVLSGVSVTWYTWLEQGRPINPSAQVLDAVGRVLGLDAAALRYVHSLAGLPPSSSSAAAQDDDGGAAALQRLLDALRDSPAYALDGHWNVVGWNGAYEHLYPGIARSAPQHRNLLRLVFTDPEVRALLPDWPETSRRFLGEFRAETVARRGDAVFRRLVEQLQADSPEFADGWGRHDVGGFVTRERVFHHPGRGTVTYEHHQLRPVDQPDLQVVVYTAAARSG